MAKIKQLQLLPVEMEALLDATNAYQEILRKKKEDVGIYLNQGINAGLISGGGDNWERDKHYWDMRDSIRRKIDEEERAVISMRNKIWEVTRS